MLYFYNETNTADVYNLTDRSRLNLITCAGTWMPSLKTYSHRLVVFTELVH